MGLVAEQRDRIRMLLGETRELRRLEMSKYLSNFLKWIENGFCKLWMIELDMDLRQDSRMYY